MLSLFPKIRSSWTWETLSELPVFMELDWLYRFSLCVSGYEFVWQSLEDSPSPSYSSQTLKRQREKLVPPLLGDLPLPRGAESTDLLPALLSERATEEKRAWKDWGVGSRARLTVSVSTRIEYASAGGSGHRHTYLRADRLPEGTRVVGGAASSCRSPRPKPLPTAAWDMGPVCCKPDRLKKQHLQGNRKQMLESFYKCGRQWSGDPSGFETARG